MTTNSAYFKRSLLRVDASVQFRLNRGDSLDAAVDVPIEQVANFGDLAEKLSKSSANTGGVVLPDMDLRLENKRGRWNKGGPMFKDGFVSGSEFIITANYVDDAGAAITPAFVYRGLVKYQSCRWDRLRHVFEAQISPPTTLLASEKIEPGTLSLKSFKEVILQILSRAPFTRHMTVSAANITLGWDVSSIDYYGDMVNKKVKDVLDDIMLLTGSAYYVDYSGNFIVEPVRPASPTSVCTLRAHDVLVESEEYDWEGHFTGVDWDDGTNPHARVEMAYTERERLQYDYRQLDLAQKCVSNAANRATIMANLLGLYKYLKTRVVLTCKWNPDITVNDCVTLDIPKDAISGEGFLVLNNPAHDWNEGLYWGLPQPGVSFDSARLWRVVEVKRSVDGEKMKLELVQLYSDDEV